MAELTRRHFLKNAAFFTGVLLPDLSSLISREVINKSEFEKNSQLEHWLNRFKIRDKSLWLTYDGSVSFWKFPLLISGKVGIYMDVQDDKYRGVAYASVPPGLISHYFRLHFSEGEKISSLWVPKKTIRIRSVYKKLSIAQTDYDLDKGVAFYSEVGVDEVSRPNNAVEMRPDGKTNFDYIPRGAIEKKVQLKKVEITLIDSYKRRHAEDIISGLLNLRESYGPELLERKVHNSWTVSRNINDENDKPKLNPVNVVLEEYYSSKMYLSSDVSTFFGAEEGTNIMKGWVDKDLIPESGELKLGWGFTLSLSDRRIIQRQMSYNKQIE